MKLTSFVVSLSFCLSTFSPSWAAATCFSNPIVFPSEHNLRQVIAGDLNEDGKPDLVISYDGGCAPDVGATAYLGKGTGKFIPQVLSTVKSGPYRMVLADLNGDGHLDLIVTYPGPGCNGNTHELDVLLGNGDGSFKPPMAYMTGFNPTGVAVGDFNNDGRMDVLTTDEALKDQYLSLGNGDGTLQSPVTIPTVQQLHGGGDVQVADFNHDGKLDFAIAALAADFSTIRVLIQLGNGDGTFGRSHLLPGLSIGSSLAVGDLDLDGNLDLVQLGGHQLGIWLGTGDGTFRRKVTYDASNEQSPAIGRLGTDGIPDLVLADDVTPANVELLKGKGDGTFPVQTAVPSGNSTSSIALADFNGDGLLDIAGIHGLVFQGYGTVLLNTGQCR
jgi:hypothetical protein